MKRIIILGCGFAGFEAARYLAGRLPKGWKLLLVDEHDFFTFIPLIYKVAAAQMDEKNIIFPIRHVVERKGIDFLQDIVTEIKPKKKAVQTKFGREIPYDFLLLGLGSQTNYFSVQGMRNCLDLKTIEDALKLRSALLERFMYLKAPGQDQDIRVFVVGGGFTGIETVCSLREYADALCAKFGVKKDRVKFTLLEAAPHILGLANEKARRYAERSMEEMGIRLHKDTAVGRVTGSTIECSRSRSYPYDLCIWVAGIKPNKVVEDISSLICGIDKTNVDLSMRSIKDEHIFGAGDNVVCSGIPRTAHHAIMEGRIAAENILRAICGKELRARRVYVSPLLVSLGKKKGMFVYKDFCMTGRFALWTKRLVEWHYVFTRKNL